MTRRKSRVKGTWLGSLINSLFRGGPRRAGSTIGGGRYLKPKNRRRMRRGGREFAYKVTRRR